MKVLTRTLSLLTIASLTLFFANCGGDEGGGTSSEEKAFNQLNDVWTISTVTLDGQNQITDFGGFTLTLGGTFNSNSPEGPYSYSISGNTSDPSPWPDGGDWIISTANANDGLIIRDADSDDDSIGIQYKILSNGNLELTFTVEEGMGWRTAEIGGVWVFTFTN